MKTRKAERLQSPSLSPAIRRNTQVFCRVVTSTFRGSVVASLTRRSTAELPIQVRRL
jgi:hypothetical protein